MTPSASAASAPLASIPHGPRLTSLVVGAVLGLLIAQYLAGAVLLCLLHAEPREATPVTWWRYAYYYSGEPRLRTLLAMSVGAGVAPVLACVALLVWPRRRSLHGAARFATRAEVRRAGLLGEEGIILVDSGAVS